MSHHDKPFYDIDILRNREQAYIKKILKKYKNDPVDDALKEKIWNELQEEKHKGTIKIPFKVVMRKDPAHIYPDVIEVILDTKV